MFDEEDQTEELELDELEAEEKAADEEVSEPDLEDAEAEGGNVEEEVSDEEEGQDPEASEDESETFSVSFGGENDGDKQEAEAAPEWARELRKRHREASKENKELRAKLEAIEGAKEQAKLGEKPTLEGCNYDESKFETELASWQEQKRAVDKQKQVEKETQEAEREAWQKRVDGYNEAKKKLAAKAPDFEEAEDELRDILSPIQQGALLHVAKQPDILVYALGKNPKKAHELAGIKDQALFIAELVRLETEMKVKNVKKAPKPERRVGGSGGVPKSATNALEKAREKAEKTGDYTEVNRIRAKMRVAK